jgi:hypothetical protein
VNDSEGDRARALTGRLLQIQNGMNPDQASRIAKRIVGDPQIWAVARQWEQTGAWPDEPQIEGWTPSQLGRLYRPSFVLTALLWLKQDPEGAKCALRHAFADAATSSYQPRVTTDPLRSGFFTSDPVQQPPPQGGEEVG